MAGLPYYQRSPIQGSPPDEDTLADLLSLQQLVSWRNEAEQPFLMWLLLQTKMVVAGQPEIVSRPFWLRTTAQGEKIGALKKAVSESEGSRSNENMFPSQKRHSSSCFFLSLVFLQHIVLGSWVAFCVPVRGLANLGISSPVVESLVAQEVPLAC